MSHSQLLDHRGIKQFSVIKFANGIPTELQKLIAECRASVSAREIPVLSDSPLIILSQDCDLIKDGLLTLELIAATPTKKRKYDKNLAIQKNRSVQKLAMPFQEEYWQLESERISVIDKSALAKFITSFEVLELPEAQKRLLLNWRLSCYSRRALPQPFNDGFFKYYVKQEGNELGNLFTKFFKEIYEVYAYISPMNNENADEYCVSISVLLRAGIDASIKSEIETTLSKHLEILHHDAKNRLYMLQIGDPRKIGVDIFLDKVVYPRDVTIEDIDILAPLNLDFFCYEEI